MSECLVGGASLLDKRLLVITSVPKSHYAKTFIGQTSRCYNVGLKIVLLQKRLLDKRRDVITSVLKTSFCNNFGYKNNNYNNVILINDAITNFKFQ